MNMMKYAGNILQANSQAIFCLTATNRQFFVHLKPISQLFCHPVTSQQNVCPSSPIESYFEMQNYKEPVNDASDVLGNFINFMDDRDC